MFARHLPPSADVPRVLALDSAAADELRAAAQVTAGAGEPGDAPQGRLFDAIAGTLPPELETLRRFWQWLRPGGRLILSAAAEPQVLLDALVAAGFIHCLVEPAGAITLYRGERPSSGSTRERQQQLAGAGEGQAALPRFLFLLITQTPNKPAWTLQPGDAVEWQAATLLDTAGQPRLVAFSSLVRAVAFMQNAILASTIAGVNKVGKFPASAASAWPLPLLLNPEFESVRAVPSGPPLRVDPLAAMVKDEG